MVSQSYTPRVHEQASGRPISRKTAYACIANGLREEILANPDFIKFFVDGMEEKFLQPLQSYEKGYTVSDEPSDAGFALDAAVGHITLFTGGLDLMMDEISGRRLDRQTRRSMQRHATEAYVLHELRHVSQGIPDFGDVQHIKANVGLSALGQLDLIADIEAARVHAAIQIGRSGEQSWHGYWKQLRTNLFFMGDVATKAFKAPTSKPHKIQRVLGIAAMTARLDRAIIVRAGARAPSSLLPPDAIIWPAFSNLDAMTLMALWPDYAVLQANVEMMPGELGGLASQVDSQPFQDTVAAMAKVLRRAGVV